jgi:hypothetical protein
MPEQGSSRELLEQYSQLVMERIDELRKEAIIAA